jgi:hypothetical protein
MPGSGVEASFTFAKSRLLFAAPGDTPGTKRRKIESSLQR